MGKQEKTEKEEQKERKFRSAEDILATEDIEEVDVYVPEWDTLVRLRSLSGLEAQKFVEAFPPGERQTASAVNIVALSAIKEDGTPLFTKEQVEELKAKSLRAIMRLQKVTLKINGLSEEGLKDTKEA